MLVSVFGEHLLPCTSNLYGPTWHAAQPPSPQIDIGPSPDFDQQVVGEACIGKVTTYTCRIFIVSELVSYFCILENKRPVARCLTN